VLAFWRIPRIRRVREIGRYGASGVGADATLLTIASALDRHFGRADGDGRTPRYGARDLGHLVIVDRQPDPSIWR